MIYRDTLDFKKASRPYKICKWQGSLRFFGKVHDKIWGHPTPGKRDWTCLWEGQKCNLTEPFACSRSCTLRLNGCSCQIHKSEPQLSGVSQESSRGWWNTAKPLAFADGTAPRPAETNACLITHIYTFLDSPALKIKPTNPQTQRNGFTLICGNTQTHTHEQDPWKTSDLACTAASMVCCRELVCWYFIACFNVSNTFNYGCSDCM